MNRNKWFLNGGRGSGRSFRLLCEAYENKIAELKKKNLDAKEIIKKLMVFAEIDNREYEEAYKEAEQFLSEVEK